MCEKAQSPQLKGLLEKRQVLLDEIGRIYNSGINNNSLGVLKACNSRIQKLSTQFDAVNSELVEINSGLSKSRKISFQEGNDTLNSYVIDIEAKIFDLEAQVAQPVNNASVKRESAHSQHPQYLKTIQIPVLTDQNWEYWNQIFESLVDSDVNLTPIIKYHYLHNSLSAEAKALIAQYLPISEVNYELAKLALKNHYDNPRKLASRHVSEMLNAPVIGSKYSTEELVKMIQIFRNSMSALEKHNIEDLYKFILFQLCYGKIPSQLRKQFEIKQADSKKIYGIDSLLEFLQERVCVSDLDKIVSQPENGKSARPSSPKPQKPKAQAFITAKAPMKRGCTYCKEQHFIFSCPQFNQLGVTERHAFVTEKRLCKQCLGSHATEKCTSKFKCRTCQSAVHNSLLHLESTEKVSHAEPPPVCTLSHGKPPVSTKQTLLATAMVTIHDSVGQPIPARALLDGGSMLSFITERMADVIGVKRQANNTWISGIGGTRKAKGKVTLRLSSPRDPSFSLNADFLILPEICNPLPSRPISDHVKNTVQNLELADPTFHVPGEINLLIGADLGQVLSDRQPLLHLGKLTAQHTEFGYVISGIDDSGSNTVTSMLSVDVSLNEAVERFWRQEEEPTKRPLDPLEQLAEDFYVETTTRDDKGRYQVRLPFHPDALPLVENKRDPVKAYMALEKRLQENPDAAELYQGYFNDYLIEEMMEKASTAASYKLIHHPVIKKDTKGNYKVRPVFEGNALDKNGRSLNGLLLAGPSLHSDIYDVLLSFRFKPVGLICDIRKMYNSIVVHSDDRKYQHIVLRENPNSEIKEYELTRVTFGLTPSGFLAQRAIKSLIADEGEKYPIASQVLEKSIYVDDIAAAFSDVETAVEAKNQLIAMLGTAKMELRKWASSHPECISDMPSSHRTDIDMTEEKETIKILGISWSPANDTYSYQVGKLPPAPTKRSVLSLLAHTYDVTGWLAPVTLFIKQFLKSLWVENCDWDAEIPPHLVGEWTKFSKDFHLLENLRIPRYIPVDACKRVELIGFSDASASGYGIAIYLRCIYENHATMSLIKAKGKTSPIKGTSTIPRLELQAASLLANAYEKLMPRLNELNISATYFCTDSTIVLAWLKIPIHKLQVFVANRVSNILSKTSAQDWRHVPSADNCADPASRSLTPSELLSCTVWWKGPPFLAKLPTVWPKTEATTQEIPEIKKERPVVMTTTEEESYLNRFSSLERLKRVTAWLLRFCFNAKAKARKTTLKSGPLSVDEIQNALDLVVRKVQSEHFSQFIDSRVVPKNLRPLTPFVDSSSGLVKVGGRLSNAPIPESAKHPILLPSQSRLAELLCTSGHLRTLHGGMSLTRAIVQSKFWIIGITRLVKKCIFQCKICYLRKARPPEPMMAELPGTRFNQVRPFLNTSCDFLGPILVHEGPRPRARTIKVYVCIFTCMATRATHLEVVHDLSSESFLAAIDRLTSRRGLCQLIYCDNGTNLRGGSRILNEVKDFLMKNGNEFEQLLATRQIKFQFISPTASWKNGLTERFVAIFKTHFVKVTQGSTLTFVEFETLVIKIEAVMNSRPLIPLSVDPSDTVLCPSHFLIGDNLLAVPSPNLEHLKLNNLSRWQVIKRSLQVFWKLWRTSYLQVLLPRVKWTTPVPNLEPGQVVFIKKEDTAPHAYPLAVVEEVFPHSRDQQVRVVRVRTSSGSLIRPVNKLIPLNVANNF